MQRSFRERHVRVHGATGRDCAEPAPLVREHLERAPRAQGADVETSGAMVGSVRQGIEGEGRARRPAHAAAREHHPDPDPVGVRMPIDELAGDQAGDAGNQPAVHDDLPAWVWPDEGGCTRAREARDVQQQYAVAERGSFGGTVGMRHGVDDEGGVGDRRVDGLGAVEVEGDVGGARCSPDTPSDGEVGGGELVRDRPAEHAGRADHQDP